MKPETVCVDTNVFIRLFTRDDIAQADRVIELFRQAENGKYSVLINDLILAEVAWVLARSYKMKPEQVSDYLSGILASPFIQLVPAGLSSFYINQAIDMYVKLNIGFTDAYIAAWMQQLKVTKIYTFNKRHFSRVADLIVVKP